jgi:competence protein ComEA
MPEEPSSPPPPLPPRPLAPARFGGRAEALADRLRMLRQDPRAGVMLLLVCACAAGVYWFRAGIATSEPAHASAPAAPRPVIVTSSTTGTATPSTVVVHVAGAVKRPGVVTLRARQRVVDAIDAAGGARPNADLDRLNLAAKLTDGERIAVPVKGQPAPALDPASAGSDTAGDGADAGPINLNTATLEQLEMLPGIGPTLAQAIVDERERSGGFRSVGDLRKVRGIGDARFAQVEPHVTV